MNIIFKTFLSMSFSGTLLILMFFIGKHFLKDKISRQWQYYIWLIVVLRLLLPFSPETSLMEKTYQTYQIIDQTITQADSVPPQQSFSGITSDAHAASLEQHYEKIGDPEETLTTGYPFQDIISTLANHAWLVWLLPALGILIRKITAYQTFLRYINAGSTPVSDIELLNRLSIAAEQMGVKKPIEFCINPLISSPLLIGFFRPCIVLPGTDISEKDFQYILLHELIHYKRLDIFYKWLVQATLCLHWFNPLVYLMNREINRACEFSCDEAVLTKSGYDNAPDYGKTLLDAMAAVGKYRETPGAVTLSEDKQLLKERLVAIMNFRRKSKTIRILTGALTLCIIIGSFFIGIYPAYAAPGFTSDNSQASDLNEKDIFSTREEADYSYPKAEEYYEAGSLLLFEIAFSQMDEDTQGTWMDKIYEDEEIAFFSVCVDQLSTDSPFIGDFAEKFYEDGSISFFSVLTDCMSEDMLESWLDRALEDEKIPFQSMLYEKLYDDSDNPDDSGKEQAEKEWEKKQQEEYQTVGVVKNGKNYYYQGQLVNIFLDMRPGKSFYTLNMNPAGTVNIKIIRKEDGQITGAAYMTETEVTELLGDMSDPDDN